MPTVRVFFALWPDATVASALSRIARRAAPPDARLMRAQTLHLTLAFIGDVPAERLPAIEAVGDQAVWPRCLLRLDQLGHWPHNQILWAGSLAPPDALAELANALSDGLRAIGMTLAPRPFVPHITLARRCRHAAAVDMPPVDWSVEGGVLAVSQRAPTGARYLMRRRWPAP